MINGNFILKCRYCTIVLAIFCGDIPTDHWHDGSLQEHQVERLMASADSGLVMVSRHQFLEHHPIHQCGVQVSGCEVPSYIHIHRCSMVLEYWPTKLGDVYFLGGISVGKYSSTMKHIGYLHTYSPYAPGSSTCLSMTWGCQSWTNSLRSLTIRGLIFMVDALAEASTSDVPVTELQLCHGNHLAI